MEQPYVVVGATGILAPLAALLPAGARRIGVARERALLAGHWDEVRLLDGHDASAVAALVTDVPTSFDVIAYSPTVSAMIWELLCRNADRRVIVLPSAYAAPGADISMWLAPGDVTVCQLGWHGPPGRALWHTAAEISAGCASALAAPPGHRLTVGRVRPWSERP